MQLTKAVRDILLPAMDSNGFSLVDSATAYYEFGINDDSMRVIVDKNPWPPSELRVSFCYRDYHNSFSRFDLKQLSGYQCLDLFFNNKEELETKLERIANILETYALSFLVSIRDNHVYWGDRMRLRFSVNPQQQADSYAKKKLLSMSYESPNFLYLENQIATMRGESMCKWRHNFELYADEIIGLSSYYGEVIRRNYHAKWNSGVLVYDQGSGYPDADVVNYWNYGIYIPACRLVPLNLR